jgi:hypothetical protein
MKSKQSARSVALLMCFGAAVPSALAQWKTQPITIKPGWTAIYLHVDASYQALDQLVGADAGNPIVEIWRWQAPASVRQFVTTPLSPLSSGSDWAVWTRSGTGVPTTLGALTPNAAYLVHSSATTNYTWQIKGRPAVPSYAWTTTGLNFIGYPTMPTNPPPFDNFLSLAPVLNGAEIYQYPGGDLGSYNPSLVFAMHATKVTRGQAFWIRAGTAFTDYFGPFSVSISSVDGISFSDTGSQYSFHLRNTSATNVTVTLRLVPSETPPAGQAAIVATPSILVRGGLNSSNLTYSYANLAVSNQSWTLPAAGSPGSDITVVIGVNRAALLSGPAGYYTGILEFTDSRGYTQINVPVSAQSSSTAGLWVGNALVTQVANYLKTYQRDVNNNPVMSTNGNYLVTDVNTNLGPVIKPYPLRLIVHNDGTNAALLQRVYYGVNTLSNTVVATSESALDPAQLANARRISTIALPWNQTNAPWYFTGTLAPGASLSTTVALPYDDQASNPFLHTYHPDHDNLDATFQNELPRGAESYDITRQITLNVTPTGDDFDNLTHDGQSFSGDYLETITLAGAGSATRSFNVKGSFAITRISPIPTLTQP